MLIIAGKVYVAPEHRNAHVASYADFVRDTRTKPGCLDFFIAADPVEADRANLFERWESNDLLRAFQATAEPPAPVTDLLGEDVALYEISASGSVFPE
ncbi:MAG: antibiotic biosynthesis monooxygenase [Chloroflexota bacterium]|nr:antibiotic biosynthesis monooxygenase [Chloroflexota bacterium]